MNLGKGRIEAMLKVLDVEGAVTRAGTRWLLADGDEWVYDAERYAKVTELRRREQATMASFGADGRCLMRALQEELDDPDPRDCGRCSVCAGPRYDAPPEGELVRAALEHLRSRPLTLDPKKMSPDADGKMRKIGADVLVEEGRALARIGDGGWDPVVQAGRAAGRFDDELVRATAQLVGDWKPPVSWVAAVPSSRSGDLVPDFARRLAGALGLEYHPVLERAADRPGQREMANSAAAGRQRPRRVRRRRRPAARRLPARRRPALQRLDTGDDRRPAAPSRRGTGLPARAGDGVLIAPGGRRVTG